ncbi:6-bladed beta-propeller [Algoriphagus hitonicola]|uniref:6-bladed beta-propeller protein n=1 Tax=Algoriphagus hitonicola TaxID=435880 RepID=A0A1I2Q6G5_9BACT|nr:6-bladed beta-propeller [Algoriphagus hitonicola]SFG23898.1 hypothetical protein SAMN04487988_102133 [Algoriphagus hitonicola]
MKHKLVSFFSLGLFWVLFSCEEKTISGPIEIPSDPVGDLLDIGEIFNSSELIPITLPDSVLIGNVFSSKALGDKIYIHDNFNNRILIIDSKEKKLSGIISAEGEGPGEYSQINSFDLDPAGNVYIYDFGKRILCFSDGKFNYELENIHLQVRDFCKSDKGYILVNPQESYLDYRSTIVESDSSGTILNQLGGEPDYKASLPNTFFQKFSNTIYINDNPNQEIILYDQLRNSQEKLEFKISGEDRPQLVDFWVADAENIFTVFPAKNDSIILFSQIKNSKFLRNLKGIFSSDDFLPVNKFPYRAIRDNYDYLIYNTEELKSLLDYFQYFPEAKSYVEENGMYYLKEDKRFSISKEKIQAIVSQLDSIKNSNSILIRKFSR